MKNHYATQRIIDTITNQQNDHFIINDDIKYITDGSQEPSPIYDLNDPDTKAAIERLNQLFENPGAQIIMETHN